MLSRYGTIATFILRGVMNFNLDNGLLNILYFISGWFPLSIWLLTNFFVAEWQSNKSTVKWLPIDFSRNRKIPQEKFIECSDPSKSWFVRSSGCNIILIWCRLEHMLPPFNFFLNIFKQYYVWEMCDKVTILW